MIGAAVVAFAAGIASCAGDDQAAEPSLCERDVAAVASGSRGVGLDRFDLALTSCSTVDELSAALALHPGLVRGDGAGLAQDRCATNPPPAVFQSAICAELGLGGSVTSTTDDPGDPGSEWLDRHLDAVALTAEAMRLQFVEVRAATDESTARAACEEALATADAVRDSSTYADDDVPLEWSGLVDVYRWAMSECASDNLEGAQGLFPEVERLIGEFDAWRTAALSA